MPSLLPTLTGAASRDAAADVGLTVLRVVSGLSLALAHGLRKLPPSSGFVERVGEMGFPAPELFAWGATAAELGGGLLLAIGLFTRPAALLIALNMLVVTVLAHAGDAFGDRELGLFYGVIGVAFVFLGAGRFSLDALFRRSQSARAYGPLS